MNENQDVDDDDDVGNAHMKNITASTSNTQVDGELMDVPVSVAILSWMKAKTSVE